MTLLTEGIAPVTRSTFADGVEFEETFPEGVAQPKPQSSTTTLFDAQLDARVREAEAKIMKMLVEWQQRFERRFEERLAQDERAAAQRGVQDDERMRAWRAELEQAWRGDLERAIAARPAVAQPVVQPLPASSADTHDPFTSVTSARDLARAICDVARSLTPLLSFSLAVHHAELPEVAYRYRVAADGELGVLLRREPLEDGPASPAARADGWSRVDRAVRYGWTDVVIHTAQLALRAGGLTIAVLTLQSERDPIDESALTHIADLAQSAGPRLVELRDRGSLRGQ